jgi:hypothetical protein
MLVQSSIKRRRRSETPKAGYLLHDACWYEHAPFVRDHCIIAIGQRPSAA